LGAVFQLLVCLLNVLSRALTTQPLGPTVIMLYMIGLAWVLVAGTVPLPWYSPLVQAVFLVVPLGFFARQTLYDTGAMTFRLSRPLAQRLADRRDWPHDLADCRTLPGVKALRESLHLDASPVLPLLHHPRPQVQIAALAALEYRKNWRVGQAEMVLQVALRASEPLVRATAVAALANLEERSLIEALAEFLRDPSPLVRLAAAEALLWNTE